MPTATFGTGHFSLSPRVRVGPCLARCLHRHSHNIHNTHTHAHTRSRRGLHTDLRMSMPQCRAVQALLCVCGFVCVSIDRQGL